MRRGLSLVLAAGVVLAVGGCGERVEVFGVGVGPTCPTLARPLSGLATSEDDANVHLYVSNQSFEDPAVTMRVRLEDAVVVDQEFEVCGQHNWVSFPLRLEPGWHDLVATTPSGLVVESRVDVPEGPGERYVVLSHWTQDTPHLSVDVTAEPVGFA